MDIQNKQIEKLTLLLVEDDEVDRRAYRRWLDAVEPGYQYTLAASLAEAQALLAANRFDAIISDYNLGDGTAFDLFERANQSPLIVVTGVGDETIAVEAIKAGAADYLIKDSQRHYLQMLPRIINKAVQHAKAVAARQRAENRSGAFANLAQLLNPITSPKEAAKVIVAVADQLVGWDAAWLALYVPADDELLYVLMMDIVGGKRGEVPPEEPFQEAPSPLVRTVLAEGKQLLLREPPESDKLTSFYAFGDTERQSASLMFVPIRNGPLISGVLSIQSYQPYAYTPADLDTLQALADHAGGAMERIRAEEKLRQQNERLAAIVLENDRLHNEAQKQLHDLSLLYEGSILLSSSLELEQVLQNTAERLARATRADACAISGYYPTGEAVMTLAQYNSTAQWVGDEVGKVYRLTDYPATQAVLESHGCLAIRTNDPAADTAEVALLREWGVQSLLMLPLVVGGQPIGLVEIYRVQSPAGFAPGEINLCEALAQQAAVAIQTARLFEQAHQELGRRQRVENELRSQKALLQSLVSLARAATEFPTLEATLQNVLAIARHLTAAEGGTIFLLNEEQVISRSITSRDSAATTDGGPFGSGTRLTGLVGWVVGRQQPALVADTQTDERWLNLPGEATRSALVVPITSGSWVGGALSLTHHQPGHFSYDHLLLIESAAGQIALALRNVQIYESQRRMAERQTMLYEVLRAAGGQLKVEALVKAARETIARYASWSWIAVALPSEDQRRLIIYADDLLPNFPTTQYMGQGVAGRTYLSGETQYVPDVTADPDYLAGWPNTRSELVIPLRRGENVLGVLNLESEEMNGFSQEDRLLAESLADAIALALDNASLYQESQKHLVELSALYSVTQMTTQSLMIGDVLNQALLSALSALGFDYGFIALTNELSGKLGLVVSHQVPERVARYFQERELEQTLCGYVHHRQQSLILADLAGKSPPAIRTMAEQLASMEVCAYAGAPLLDFDRSLGTICLFGSQPLTNKAVAPALLAAIGHQIALAVVNAQLHRTSTQKHGQLNALIESSRDGILLISPDQHVLVVNATTLELLRLPGQPQDWINRPITEALSVLKSYGPEVVKATIAEMRRVQQGDEPIGEGEYEVSHRVIHWYNLPVVADDRPLGRLIMLHDVSNERALEQMREDLVRDLRNPLTSISGALELLAEDFNEETSSFSRQMLTIAQSGVQQLVGLSSTILDANRLENGRLSLNRQRVEVASLVNELFQIHEVIVRDRRIRLQNDIELDLPPAWADRDLIRRVLQSLIGNAIKFTPAGGTVSVNAQPAERSPAVQEVAGQAGYLLVGVHDGGPVIPADRRGLFFAGSRQPEHGRGVGLAFCRLAVEAHGGRLWIAGSSGQGTAVQFTLPIGR
jgi:GAF domain-containing protein/nitrogen-specific signal transduction histidine kinase/ActR/RegA family two-component response regulator